MRRKTVFVLGAGSSCEVDLPDGNELKNRIADVLRVRVEHGSITRGDDLVLSAIRAKTDERGSRDVNPLLGAARVIVENMPHQASIDNFVDMRDDPDIEFLAKVAIARCILKAERTSKLANQKSDHANMEKAPDTWLGKFSQLLMTGSRLQTIRERLRNVGFVIFNYDRCFEHYMHAAFTRTYGVDATEAASLVSEIEIYHPYGHVGYLPWQTNGTAPWQQLEAGARRTRFGDELDHGKELIHVASGIRTFTEERTLKAAQLGHLRAMINNASQLVFLGFGFYEQNMRLLFDTGGPLRDTRVFATLFNMSAPNQTVVVNALNHLGLTPSLADGDLENAKCAAFLEARNRVIAIAN